jgi:hypothetical protein
MEWRPPMRRGEEDDTGGRERWEGRGVNTVVALLSPELG